MNYQLEKVYILIYFIYGLAFFTMGISILQNKVEKENSIFLLKSIKFLGFFGLIHGITEWVLMIIITGIYSEYTNALYILASLLNTLSFSFLAYYGIVIIDYSGKYKKVVKSIPIISFTIWSVGLILSLLHLTISEQVFLLINLFSRYFIGLPASILTAIALYRSIKLINLIKLDKIANRIKGLAISFFVYGILAGIFVRKTHIFPSNILNSELFYKITGMHVELARTVTAIIITILSVTIIDLFRWVNEQKITRLTNLELINDERRRLCQNLHDVIIQNIFATGLKVEFIIEEEVNNIKRNNLLEVKKNLNETIYQVRDYIDQISTQKINIEGLKSKITDFVVEQKKTTSIDIDFYQDITDIAYNNHPSEKLVEIYFVAQEAIINAIKHSKATHIVITITINLTSIVLIIFDDGVGFSLEENINKVGYGITSMNERALTIGGVLNIKSSKKGTQISLFIPWRSEYEQ